MERERLLEERAEARANELALRKAKRRTDEFLSLASHELRAPLTIIKANAQLIKRHMRKIGTFSQELGSEGGVNEQMLRRLESIPEMLDRSIMQVDLLDRLVGDLLDFSRIQTETLSLFLNPSDLTEIVRNVVEGQKEVYQERDIRLRLPDEERLMIVNADVARIGQVLTNYLVNAFKYSEPDAPVEIEVRVDGEQARVLVRDQGVGLPPEALSRIWERFYREPGIVSISGPSTSLGLGLHICETIMHLHYGQVGVESVRGQGSTFWFALPLMQIGHEEGERV